MRKYFKKLLSYSVYRRTLLTYSISIFVVTMLMSVCLYGIFIVSIKTNAKESTQLLLAQLTREVDNLKNDVDNVMAVITNDSKTLKFVQNREEKKQDNYYLFLKLLEFKSSYSYIQNISVVNFESDICIQALGGSASSEDNISFAASLHNRQKNVDVRTIQLPQADKNVVTFMQYLPYYNAAVLTDVNADWFQYCIAENPHETRSIYIMDLEGRAVTSNTSMIVDNKPLSDYFYSVLTKKNHEESFVYDDEVKRQLVFFSKSPNFGWWFIDVQDYSYFNSKFKKISFTFVGIALVLVLVSMLLSILFNHKIRKPLTRLADQCRNMLGSEEMNEEDEFKYLDTAIARGKHEKYLREKYIRALFLQNLMLGEPMPLYVPQKELDSLEEQYRSNYYCVMLLNIHNMDALEKSVKEEEFKIFRYIICNLSEEIFGEGFRCNAADMGEESVALLFMLEKKEIAAEYILSFRQLKEYAGKKFRIDISGSLGLIVSDQKDIALSYQRAKQYLELNQLINREDLIDSNDQISSNYQEKNRNLVESIIEYTEYNFNNPELSLKSISMIFGLSTTYLGKIFRSIQGEAYAAFVTRYRLEKSKQALLATNKTVNEIAAEIGFTNSTYYATLFKNTYGMTPSAFRNKQHGAG